MTDEGTARPIRVDAHQHFWPQPTRFLYPWMTDEQAALRRPFGLDDLRPLLQARAIDWTVLVHDALAEVLTSIGMSESAQAKVFGENARRFYVPSA